MCTCNRGVIAALVLATGWSANALSIGGDRSALSRRDVFTDVTAATVGAGLLIPNTANAADSDAPIAVIGASGRTGTLCVGSCLRRGIPVRALTRSGSWILPELTETESVSDDQLSTLLTIQQCDAKDPSAIADGIAGCRGVIYAASASKKGGNAKEIDNEAVVSAGNACIAEKVGRYVVISSTAVTRPKSLGYIFTNVYQNIMGEKRLGELGVMGSYSSMDPSVSRCSYSIIRPGGLEEPKLNTIQGPSALELSQGDGLAGIISRADLAEVAVEAALSKAEGLQNASFELYYTDSAQPCEGRFKALLESGDVPRIHGDTYDALFGGLRQDGKYFVPT